MAWIREPTAWKTNWRWNHGHRRHHAEAQSFSGIDYRVFYVGHLVQLKSYNLFKCEDQDNTKTENYDIEYRNAMANPECELYLPVSVLNGFNAFDLAAFLQQKQPTTGWNSRAIWLFSSLESQFGCGRSSAACGLNTEEPLEMGEIEVAMAVPILDTYKWMDGLAPPGWIGC